MVLELTLMLLGVIVWVVCGLLGYGLMKNFWQEFYLKTDTKKHYRLDDEGICIMAFLAGPAGLVFTLVIALLAKWIGKYKFGFCYHIPKELRKRGGR